MSTRRIVTEKSDRIDWKVPIPFVSDPELQEPNIEKRLFAEWARIIETTDRLSHSDETTLFKQMHYCGHKLHQIYSIAAESGETKLNKSKFAYWTNKHRLVRSRLVEANIGLVYDRIQNFYAPGAEHDEMVGEGMMTLLRSIDAFNPWRGYRFSTYACNALNNCFFRMFEKEATRKSRLQLIANNPDVDDISDRHEEVRIDRMRQILLDIETNMTNNGRYEFTSPITDRTETISQSEWMIVKHRFGAFGAKRITLENSGKMLRELRARTGGIPGGSKELARQTQVEAVRKIGLLLKNELALIE